MRMMIGILQGGVTCPVPTQMSSKLGGITVFIAQVRRIGKDHEIVWGINGSITTGLHSGVAVWA